MDKFVLEAEPEQASVAREKSIAVLPFVNMSADPDQEYFADGISEELLNTLVRMGGLQVAGRTSSFSFKGSDADLKTIGATLGVGAILEGSVRKAGNRVRITAQLVDAERGFHLWSETYDRKLDDIFAIQDEIARSIADALRLELGLSAQQNPNPGRTENLEAFNAYVKGLELLNKESVPAYPGVAPMVRARGRAGSGLCRCSRRDFLCPQQPLRPRRGYPRGLRGTREAGNRSGAGAGPGF